MEKERLKEILDKEIAKLIEHSEGYARSELAIHEIEKDLLRQVLSMCQQILKWTIQERLNHLPEYEANFLPGTYSKSKGMKSRDYLSLFGPIKITRPAYWSEACGMYHKLDEHLKLPLGRSWSYNLQELIGENASENDYRESIRVVNKILDLNLNAKSAQRNAAYLGPHVEYFYSQRRVKIETAPKCFSASFDGKGVSKIVKVENVKERLKKGEKRGTKQMATVTVTSCFTPKNQSVEGIITGLMGKDPRETKTQEQNSNNKSQNDNRWHENIHRRAFLGDQEKAIDYGINDIKRRMKNPESRFVVPIDAGKGLEDQVIACVKKYGLESQFDGIILDIIHVSEYVWDAATAVLGENAQTRTDWVRNMLTDLLNSKTDKVIKDLVAISEKTSLSKSKKEKVDTAITYFSNHKHKMDYKRFIDKGYPVSSALAESTCGHLVKERMEQTGMRWSSAGAQNILDLRAVKINNDVPDFIDFVIDQERKVYLTKIAA